jgi:sec-independent protein translocase protein TatA
MGLSGTSPGSLILILVIAALLFGTKRLRTMGEDLGEAVRGFRKGLNGEKITSDNEKL